MPPMSNHNHHHSRKTGGLDLDLQTVRAKLGGQAGPKYWRSLEELAGTEEFTQFLHREFPEQASEWSEGDPSSRRNFLRLMAASLALAGVGVPGCGYNDPPEKILPYVRAPENLVQGKSQIYATALSVGGYGVGVLAESHMGRPTMVEGNPSHPDSLGSLDYLRQASLLTLYDPDRSQVVLHKKEISTFDGFVLAATSTLDAQRREKGSGLRVLTETVTSPSLVRQIREFLKDFPRAVWHQYEPAAPHALKAGLKLAFGRDVSVRYHVEKADVILALDDDFLSAGGNGSLSAARAFGIRREPLQADKRPMNRLYAVEATLTVTGGSADQRLPLRSQDIAAFAQGLAKRLGVAKVPEAAAAVVGPHKAFLDALAKDLQANKGKSLVLVGASQPAYVNALAAAMNQALGNVGTTVEYAEPVEAEPINQVVSLAELCGAMHSGKVDTLFVFGGNPAYTTPVASGFVEGLKRVGFKARLGLYEDETSALCDWHVPEAHELETWGDIRGTDGTTTIQQPLIAPLYGGRSVIELIAAVTRHPSRSGYEIVRDTWRAKTTKGEDFETYWKTSVHNGVVANSAVASLKLELKDLGPAPAPASTEGFEVIFRPDPTIWDGRYSNNGWLQELPKPLTKLTWGNAVLMSPTTASRLGIEDGDLVKLTHKDREIEGPAMQLPGHAEKSLTITFGFGRTKTGRVGTDVGFNAYALWPADAPAAISGVTLRKTGASRKLASTQMHRAVDDYGSERGIIREATLKEFQEHPDFVKRGEHGHEPPAEETLYRDDFTPKNLSEPDYQWAMVVDLNACTGCSACVLACQAENNIPVVGRDQVLRSREMHWMDVDVYFEGKPGNPKVVHQPRLCMHCEKAPCEVVCPVAATVHDHEGLNSMIYNRCVGTRFCSNNCPYKVRHFNFLQYADLKTESLKLLNNPDVTVRARGVMEKCTYCVQRINEARYKSELEGRRIKDGDIVTACQSSCPTQAITFGDMTDPNSAVSRKRAETRNYSMLGELNTRPRTTYLAKLRNPNPEIFETEPRDGV